MPAPRLLDKRMVNTELATQRKRDIEAGVKIAQKVDAVRETLTEEENRLELFRRETLTRIQTAIDSKINERDSLIEENEKLKEERIRLSAPIELSQAWEEITSGKKEIADLKYRLTQHSIEIIAQDRDNQSSATEIAKEKENVKRKEQLAERTLIESEEKLSRATSLLDNARLTSEKTLKNAKEIEKGILEREQSVINQEKYLTAWEGRINAHDFDLTNRERKLKSREEIFIKAQNYLKNKKYGV